MNNSLPKTIFAIILFLISGFAWARPAFAAPNLSLSPTAQTVTQNTEYQFTVSINAESNQAFGADVILVYPSADIDVTNIATGGFFPDFTSSIVPSTGRLEMHGYFSSLYEGKSGSGTFATITYKPKKDAGSGTVSFACSGNTETIILATNGQNILSCASLNQTSLTYSSGQQAATPTPTPTPTQSGGGTNTTPSCVTLGATPISGTGVPFAVTFTCSGVDPDGDITAAEFQFGDETSQLVEKNVGSPGSLTTTHTYTTIGTLGASCRVRDNNYAFGPWIDACKKIITIRQQKTSSGQSTSLAQQQYPAATPTPQAVGLVEEPATPPLTPEATPTPMPTPSPQVARGGFQLPEFPWWLMAVGALLFLLLVLLLKKRNPPPMPPTAPPAAGPPPQSPPTTPSPYTGFQPIQS